ncbi:MAG: IS30 family transposase, partial [Gaiellaceae bacterium]
MGAGKRQQAIRAMRGQMWSPGRPSVARREDRQRFWRAIAAGRSSEEAAAAAGVSQAVGSRWFRDGGGMPPISLAPLSGRYLSFAEREEIALLHAQRVGVRGIARRLGRSPSTVSRELRRNASTRSHSIAYRATTAQWHAERRASRPKVSRLAANDALRTYVQDRLAGAIARPDGSPAAGPEVRWVGRRHGRRTDRRWASSWSPEQVSNRLRVDFPDDPSMRISHEAIYQSLYVQGRGALRRELTACLRTGRALRVPRARTRGRGKGFVRPEIMISERPPEADDRAVPGHWEGDLILGLDSSAIGTLVERTTRYLMLLHLPRMNGHGDEPRVKNGPALAGHGAEAVRDAIAGSIRTLPEQLRRSLTWDQGAEMAEHARLRIDAGIDIYFCDPHSPWQRGSNENTNGLLRQYFPRGTDLSRHSADELAAVALALNTRPRKTLGWRTPAEASLLPAQRANALARLPGRRRTHTEGVRRRTMVG